MYPTHGEQQKKEIETIRKRTIELELSDADVKRIAEKAGAHGLTVGKLLESFIGDLVCGTYSNGSDERDIAGQWFERCWFGMFPEMTFLSYLVEWGGMDEVLQAWDDITDSTENIKIAQEELSSGVIKSRRGEPTHGKTLYMVTEPPVIPTVRNGKRSNAAILNRSKM